MITLYTSKGCSRCAMVKQILDARKIEYRVQVYEDMSQEQKDELLKKTDAADIYSFPVIEREDGSITNSVEGL